MQNNLLPIAHLKSDIKALALKIKQAKRERSPNYSGTRYFGGGYHSIIFASSNATREVEEFRIKYRRKHIALSIMRGTDREDIENIKRSSKYHLPEQGILKIIKRYDIEKYDSILREKKLRKKMEQLLNN